jgi:hypothetical protein
MAANQPSSAINNPNKITIAPFSIPLLLSSRNAHKKSDVIQDYAFVLLTFTRNFKSNSLGHMGIKPYVVRRYDGHAWT